eukprot:CAMPEP_0174914672 /NCGR_PEP_ID=MMETSP0167-20121228/80963_1 /TAXON_ID=38298 /ORGANISM="Rhodella maculata, Strain CCMP736" /LENGTH=183 /DNA_ID=CAMNT_0016159443 /DNA_START=559 /DNA_END=1109 /DNA_ORIENTATION=+
MSSYADRLKTLVAKYGRLALAVHVTGSAVAYSGCYLAVARGANLPDLLRRANLLPARQPPDGGEAGEDAGGNGGGGGGDDARECCGGVFVLQGADAGAAFCDGGVDAGGGKAAAVPVTIKFHVGITEGRSKRLSIRLVAHAKQMPRCGGLGKRTSHRFDSRHRCVTTPQSYTCTEHHLVHSAY